MNIVDKYSSAPSHAEPAGAGLLVRPLFAWPVSVLLGIALLIIFVDGRVAEFVATLPSSFKETVAMAASPLRGKYFILLSLSTTILCYIGSVLAAGEWRGRMKKVAIGSLFVFSCTIAALLMATLLKIAIGRARPELMGLVGAHAFTPFSTTHEWTSFPSGETSMLGAFFGSCAVLAWRRGRESLAALLLFPPLLIAISRPLMGAHFPSDVLAALALSAAIVMLIHRFLAGRLMTAGVLPRN